MPKEIIYSAGAVSDEESGYHAKVGWTAERHVQIGVEANGGRSLFWMLLGVEHGSPMRDQRLSELGTAVDVALDKSAAGNGYYRIQAVLDALDTFTHGQFSGVWVDLDRGGCNRLIRALRKARDAAYGRDE